MQKLDILSTYAYIPLDPLCQFLISWVGMRHEKMAVLFTKLEELFVSLLPLPGLILSCPLGRCFASRTNRLFRRRAKHGGRRGDAALVLRLASAVIERRPRVHLLWHESKGWVLLLLLLHLLLLVHGCLHLHLLLLQLLLKKHALQLLQSGVASKHRLLIMRRM